MPIPYKEHERQFEWKFDAKEYIAKLKRAAKKSKQKIVIELLPETKFSSSIKRSVSRIVGYYVRWYYKPLRK